MCLVWQGLRDQSGLIQKVVSRERREQKESHASVCCMSVVQNATGFGVRWVLLLKEGAS